MSTTLARRQAAQNKKDSDRAFRARQRAELKQLRAQIKDARAARGHRLKAVTEQCRAARRAITERAKRARVRLSESIRRTRSNARGLCLVARGEARTQTIDRIDRAIRALEEERALQSTLRIWGKGKSSSSSSSSRGRARATERRAESDDEVRANIDDPALHVVWEAVKHRIKPKGRSSRTEVFAEWVGEHKAEVFRIMEADAERHLVELVRKERQLAKVIARPQRRAASGDVPF